MEARRGSQVGKGKRHEGMDEYRIVGLVVMDTDYVSRKGKESVVVRLIRVGN